MKLIMEIYSNTNTVINSAAARTPNVRENEPFMVWIPSLLLINSLPYP